MREMKAINILLTAMLLVTLGILSSCSDEDEPAAENEEEIITDVILTFTPEGGGAAVVASAQDPDGEGSEDLEIMNEISLAVNTTYSLTLSLENSIEGESISEEVEEEAAEHMFFFAWTSGLFADPEGNGNIDNRADAVNYVDFDENSQPVGLETTWSTGDAATGTFRVVLKHQPDIKSATSTATNGESDVDLVWDITVE